MTESKPRRGPVAAPPATPLDPALAPVRAAVERGEVTYSELADRSGLPYTNVQRALSGASAAKVADARELLRAVGLDLAVVGRK